MIGNKIKIIIILIAAGIAGFYFSKLYQPKAKTLKLYEQGLSNYANGNYQNAYYLFSRISHMSPLKPVALYRQAMCAKILGDKDSELQSYLILLKYFSKNKLSTEVKYNIAQLLVNKDNQSAKKYFNEVIENTDDEDFKIASEYYIAKIKASEAIVRKQAPLKEIEQAFRNYLTKHPDGRLALDVAQTWQDYNENISPKDNVLIAKALYFAGLYDKSEEIIQTKTKEEDNWNVQALNAYAKSDDVKAKNLIIMGVSQYPDNVTKDDFRAVINKSAAKETNPYLWASSLFGMIKTPKNKEFLWNLKCEYAPPQDKQSCYTDLYTNYPKGEFAQNAQANIFIEAIKNKKYDLAKQVEEDFITKYPESEHMPMMMFWRAKLEQKHFFNPNFQMFYNNIINNYPDSYYAYRAFWILKDIDSFVLNTEIVPENIVYPYKYPKKSDIIYNLILVRDYEMIKKYTDDDFIKSWALYQQGDYTSSAYTAQKAMDKLNTKPPKNDVRWRLVYPLNYYKQVKRNNASTGNNTELIMSIIREESHFNTEAQSSVGAIGLMQLMPLTAHEIGERYGYHFYAKDLFNPELNIKLGSIYYASLKNQLNNDILSVASYNGGIGSVLKWQKDLTYMDIDDFVEQIPYDETKNYIKKVFKSYWNYTRIYQN